MRHKKLPRQQSFITFRTAHIGDREISVCRISFASEIISSFIFLIAQKFRGFPQIKRNRCDSADGNMCFDDLA